jgi:hypothetical protein
MAGDNESTISKLWRKYNETNFSDQKGMQSGYGNSVLPDNSKDSFNYDPRAPQENNSDSIKKLRDFVNPIIAPKIENATKNLPYSDYDPKGELTQSPVLVLPKINQNTTSTDNQQQNTTETGNQPQSNDSPKNSQENSSPETTSPKTDTQENTPTTDNKEESKSPVSDFISTIVGGIAGAFVGGVSNPFSGSSDSNVGSLSSGGSSISSALNSTPSGGDSGIVGESQFGGDDVGGKSAVEILSKIYKVLTQTNTTINQIAKDTATLAKNQTQKDISSDLSYTNAKARQNEQVINSSSPTYSNIDNSAKTEKDDKEDSSILGSIADWFTGGKKKKGTPNSAVKNMAEDASEKGGLKDAFTGPKAKKIAGGAAALAVGGTAGAMLGENYEEDNPSVFGGNIPQNNNTTPEPKVGTNVGDVAASQPEFDATKKEMAPMYKDNYTTTISNTKMSSKNDEQPVVESSTNTTTSSSQSKPEGIKVSGNKPYVLQDDGEGGKTKMDIETGEITIASPDDIKSAELQQQQDAIFKDKTLTVDEANAKSSELGRQQQDIEWNRINKENPTPGIETVENVSTTKEFKEKYGDSSATKDPLGYTLTDDHEGGKNKIDIQTRKKTKASQEEINQFYGGGPVLSDEELKQKYKDDPNFKAEDLRKSASPVTPYNYQSQITGSQSSGLSDLEKEKQAKLEAIAARRGKEGEDDAALDTEGEKVLDEFHAKKQAATASPIPNSNSDGMEQWERDEVDAYKNEVANSGMYKKVTPSTFGKATEAGNAMVDEVGGIDKREKELKAELEQQSMHSAYSDKESMDKDLNRLNGIYAERDKLTERRNEITATDEYRNASHARKEGNQQPTQQATSPTKAPPSTPSTTAGTGKNIPSVRNNDPTIRMMEQGNMWSTHVS